MRRTLLIMLLFAICFLANAQTPGTSIFYEQSPGDSRNYIEYIPGNLPIIISAPHGGVLQSGQTIGEQYYPDNDSNLPDRNCGTNERDDNTDILVREIQKEIFQLTGCYAHVIINNLHRSKLDPNRAIDEATCGNANAAELWHAYHDYIDAASASVEAKWGKGLFIDLHGQSHSIPRIEIGYNVSASELNVENLNNGNIVSKSSIRNLVLNNLNNLTHEELLRGNNSLGELFQNTGGSHYNSLGYAQCGNNSGYRAIPSATNNGSTSCDDTRPYTNPYFDGDFYNNRRHGSGIGANDGNGGQIGGSGKIDGIMTEVNRRLRDLGTYNGRAYDNRPQTLVPFAKDYAAVLLNFIDIHYNDYAKFTYGNSIFIANENNPTPIISGVSSGIFTSNSVGIVLNSDTGEIDLANSQTGEYVITYSTGTCNYFTHSETIRILADTGDDTEAPTTPTSLTASNVSATSVELTWNASTDNIGTVSYEVYQNNELIATVEATNHTAGDLAENTSYTFKIAAIDTAGNRSEFSNEVTVTTLQNQVSYCTSQSADVSGEYISNVKLATIDNTSGGQFYSDFTQITTELTKNESYTISITPFWSGTAYAEGYSVWIDYNQNGDFSDPGEQVFTQQPTTDAVVNGTFTIPNSIPDGNTRMRISMKYNSIAQPCENFNYGEVEDYTVTINSQPLDEEAPIITLIGEPIIEVIQNATYIDPGAIATDNIDGDISDQIMISGTLSTLEIGTYTLYYNVADNAGNEAVQVTRTIEVVAPQDDTPPIITLIGEPEIEIGVGETFDDPGATATDNTDGDISELIETISDVDTSIEGNYTITYTVADAAGNTTQITRTVTVVQISCSDGINVFPYHFGFENSADNWSQNTDDDIDWTINSYGTPSNQTGPEAALRGHYYAYVEASGEGEGFPTKQAILQTPCFNLSTLSQAYFSFGYHMYGAEDMGSLSVEISTDNGNSWTSVWSISGNQGNIWQNATINISDYISNNVQLRFNRITGSTWRADIAIDEISLSEDEPVLGGCINGITDFPYKQDFENTIGGWTQSATDNLDWTVNRDETPSSGTGPSDAQKGRYYLYVEASGYGTGYPYKQAIIQSPCYDLTTANAAEFKFYYHMYGVNDMGTLSLEISADDGQTWETAWSTSGDQGNSWNKAVIDLEAYLGKNIQLRFNRITGNHWRADVAIDNIELKADTADRRTATATSTGRIMNTETEKEEISDDVKLTVYPNPVRGDYVKINLSSGNATTYRITNMYGQEVKRGKIENQINVAQLRSGMYFMEVSDGTKTFTKKFIKQ